MMHTNLVAFYERIFAFAQYHNWNINDIYEMLPWEFDVMSTFLSNYLETMEMERKQAINERNLANSFG